MPWHASAHAYQGLADVGDKRRAAGVQHSCRAAVEAITGLSPCSRCSASRTGVVETPSSRDTAE